MSKSQHGIQKIEVTYVLVNSLFFISSSDVIYAICPGQTVLVTLMLSKNKSRALQHETNVAEWYRELQVLLHTDVAHMFGKVPVDLMGDLGEADMVTLVGHKIMALKDITDM